MAGLDPAIHVLVADLNEDVDARVEPGHDDEKFPSNSNEIFNFPRT